ncbi:PREDICTED: lysoplasmalogenase-like protein TMEM86A [Priapulus caudatus]|uniref:lysoplasmalogenase n=1 Tax=Priapulus caudatus TaxID=37621 RepID=A0ABM1F490_PRICU|nr:PREDICTED: lysoplasmalogenase-like protein TMEM86A [Priapulus caudatus]
MTSPKAVVKSVGPKLVPFFKTAAVYFVLFLPDTHPSALAMLVKCLPVISLIVFVLLHGMNLFGRHEVTTYSPHASVAGGPRRTQVDACPRRRRLLVWDAYFLHGMWRRGRALGATRSAPDGSLPARFSGMAGPCQPGDTVRLGVRRLAS